jgi:hypothetical protein
MGTEWRKRKENHETCVWIFFFIFAVELWESLLNSLEVWFLLA